ncbi:MAG: branched-chain amino acid aminotransferase [Chitinophagales bacterium]|nr:branched-chain amino acid aminotransferase [Chitinophagales bacterium]
MSVPELKIQKTQNSRLADFDFSNIPFGKNFSDHMLIAEYSEGQWVSNEIVPYGNLSLSPATTSIHYAQSVFEGMKAHRDEQGHIALFRPEENFKRINRSGARISMPPVPEEIFLGGLNELIKLDHGWVPKAEGTSLYIRPFMFGTEPFIGVKTPNRYLFVIITSPVGAYYSEDVSVYVDDTNARAVKGVGAAKFAGNYAASLMPVDAARAKGYKDVLWLDAEQHEIVQEVGTMNIFFVKNNNTLLTPALDAGFLPGITRDSIIQLAKYLGYTVEEARWNIHDIVAMIEKGEITEIFGTGTAAVITYINRLGFQGKDYHFDPSKYMVSVLLKDTLVKIQKGIIEDPFGWVKRVL